LALGGGEDLLRRANYSVDDAVTALEKTREQT
jgi:hypothetical protein